jgi:hypothetical protein
VKNGRKLLVGFSWSDFVKLVGSWLDFVEVGRISSKFVGSWSDLVKVGRKSEVGRISSDLVKVGQELVGCRQSCLDFVKVGRKLVGYCEVGLKWVSFLWQVDDF